MPGMQQQTPPQTLPASVLDALVSHAAVAPDAPAMLTPGREALPYAQLVDQLRETIVRIDGIGLTREHRVLAAAPNDLEGTILLLALLERTVCCPVNPAFTEQEMAALIDVVIPAVALAPPGQAPGLRAAAARRGLPVLDLARDRDGLPTLRGEARTGRLARQPPATGDEVLLLRTSGTTSAGKIVPLSERNILAGATASAQAYRLSSADRRLNVMPTFHVQGLVGAVIASLVAGSSVVCVPTFEPVAALRLLDEQEATWFSASPTMHRMLLDARSGGGTHGASLRFVRCGSAALPGALRAELAEAYGVPIVESYGMSEAHQIASTPLPPDAPARGMAPTGANVGIRDERGRIGTEAGSAGEIVITGANVIDHYLWPQEANESMFVDGWLRTGDQGILADDGSLLVTGRIKELINRGGEKLSPREVEEVLLSHPAIAQAVAFGMPDPVLTEEVAAAIVPRADAHVSDRELIAFAAGRLAPYKIPRRIVRRRELPTNATGKLQRWGLHELLASELAGTRDTRAATAAQAAQTPTEALLAGLWAFAIGVHSVGRDEDFLALGGDSLSAVSLLAVVEDATGVRFGPADLFDGVNTVAKMAVATAERRAGSAR
jgi:oxalate---CoA ligase